MLCSLYLHLSDFHGLNRGDTGMSFAELAEKYGCSTRTVRDDIKAAREMIADEMRRQKDNAERKTIGF